MSRNGLNMTNGVLDLKKESEIVGNIIVGALMYPKLIKKGDDDKAVEIVIDQFLAFRRARDSVQPQDKIDTKLESGALAAIIVDSFIAAGIISNNDRQFALEIVAEEVLVRRVMESL